MIDGEVVAFDQEGRPSFNALQNYGSAPAPVVYYVFDVMVLAGQNVMREPLQKRREPLEKKVLPRLREPVQYSAPLEADLPVSIQSVKLHGFDGLVVEVPDDLTSQSPRHSLLLSGSPPSGKLLIPLERRDVRVVEGARLEGV